MSARSAQEREYVLAARVSCMCVGVSFECKCTRVGVSASWCVCGCGIQPYYVRVLVGRTSNLAEARLGAACDGGLCAAAVSTLAKSCAVRYMKKDLMVRQIMDRSEISSVRTITGLSQPPPHEKRTQIGKFNSCLRHVPKTLVRKRCMHTET